ATATLMSLASGQAVASQTLTLSPLSSQSLELLIDGSMLDTVNAWFQISPEPATTPLNLRDSDLANDKTPTFRLVRGAAAFKKTLGTTLDGVQHALVSFDTGILTLDLPPNAL